MNQKEVAESRYIRRCGRRSGAGQGVHDEQMTYQGGVAAGKRGGVAAALKEFGATRHGRKSSVHTQRVAVRRLMHASRLVLLCG